MNRALIVALVLSACGSETIEPDVCGNGIVELGEDCDRPDAQCDNCSITCQSPGSSDECTAYAPGTTDGFVCGPDGFCHAPTGQFTLTSFFGVPASTFQITDADFLGGKDLLVQSQTEITTILDVTGDNPTLSTIQTPIVRGNASFASLDFGGGLDTLLPTADGIVAYNTSFDGAPTPYPFPSVVPANQGGPKFVQPITSEHLSIVGVAGDGTSLIYIAFDISTSPPKDLAFGALCGATIEELEQPEDQIEVFEVSPQHQVIAVWLKPLQGMPGTPRLCMISVDATGPATYVVTPVVSPAVSPSSRPVLVDLRGQVCPSLVVAQGDPATVVEFKPAAASFPCSFQSTSSALLAVPPGAVPVGGIDLAPAIAGHSIGLAMTTGIYTVTGQTLEERYRSDRALRRIRSVDLDVDGDLDAVASGFGQFGLGSDDLDILDRRPTGFLRFRYDTDGLVTTFSTGDFDGDEHLDIAFAEFDFNQGFNRLQIAYGTTDQLLPPTTVGTFFQLLSIIPTQILDSTDPFGAISDLGVLFFDPVVVGGGTAALSLLHGSPQRTMLAYFDPRPHAFLDPADPESQFRGVLAGTFTDTSFGNDVLAIEEVRGTSTVYLSRGASGGELGDGSDVSSDSVVIAACSNATPVDPTADDNKFCVDDAHYLAWRDPNEFHDIVVGVDRKLTVIAFDPGAMQNNVSLALSRWPNTFSAPAGSVVRELQQLDINGQAKLMIALVPSAAAPDVALAGGVFVCDFNPTDGPTDCVDISAKISTMLPSFDGSFQVCVDLGIAQMNAARRFVPPVSDDPDFVVLCRTVQTTPGMPTTILDGQIYRVALDFGRIEPVIQGAFSTESFQIGDVSGDGIDDLVTLEQGLIFQQLIVYRQCNSRDLGCRDSSGPDVGIPEGE